MAPSAFIERDIEEPAGEAQRAAVGLAVHSPSRAARLLAGVTPKVAAVVIMIVVWWLGSQTLPPEILPGPWRVLRYFSAELLEGNVFFHLFMTLRRIFIGFLIAMLIGIVAGTAMGVSRRLESISITWVIVTLTIPGLVYIILAFMWFGLNESAAILAIGATCAPSMIISIWQGVKSIDMTLVDMAKSFKASRLKRFLRVVLPQVLPFIFSATRYGLGLVWKVTVFTELIGRTNGIGYQLNVAFALYQMAGVIAYTLFFVIIMLIIELAIVRTLERRFFRWRADVTL